MYALLAMVMLAAGEHATDPVRSPAPDCVVLLHGLGRGPGSMRKIERHLGEAGYVTWNEGYPSRSASIEALAERYVGAALSDCRARGATRIHFVTHSLGGMLVRQYLHEHPVPELGRVVMLSPPNGGSEVAEHLRNHAFYRWIMGPAASELGTGDDGITRRLGPLSAECGIITGSASLDPWFGSWLPKPHDGKVSVASAQLDGMRDFLVVPRAHAFIMRNDDVIFQVLRFIADGRFAHGMERES